MDGAGEEGVNKVAFDSHGRKPERVGVTGVDGEMDMTEDLIVPVLEGVLWLLGDLAAIDESSRPERRGLIIDAGEIETTDEAITPVLIRLRPLVAGFTAITEAYDPTGIV